MGDLVTIGVGSAQVTSDVDRLEQAYMLFSIWLQTLFYGIYLVLFLGAMKIMLADRKRLGPHNWKVSKIFFGGAIVMFLITTFHAICEVYRLMRAYGVNANSPDIPIMYFRDYARWDNYRFFIVAVSMVWIADSLVIYRCYLIWSCNIWVVVAPLLLLVASVVVNLITLFWLKNPTKIAFEPVVANAFNLVFPVNFSQNVLTTGLIAYKIWLQHRQSKKAGLRSSGLGLLTMMKIIVESAMIYTLQVLAMLVLYFANNPAQVLFHSVSIPTMSIVFVLIAVRTHYASTRAHAHTHNVTDMFIPAFNSPQATEDSGDVELGHRRHVSRIRTSTSHPIPISMDLSRGRGNRGEISEDSDKMKVDEDLRDAQEKSFGSNTEKVVDLVRRDRP